MAYAGPTAPGDVRLEVASHPSPGGPGDVVLERRGGRVPPAGTGHEGGEPAYPAGRGRDPVPGDDDGPAADADGAGAVGHHDGYLQGHGEHVGAQAVVLQAGVENDDLAVGDDGGGVRVLVGV